MLASPQDAQHTKQPQPAIETMSSRREFLRVAATGRRWITPHFILQAMPAPKPEAVDMGPAAELAAPISERSSNLVRVGYTASKKVGNAVVRNRAKRRLREIVRLGLAPLAMPGWHYVFVARTSDHEKAFTTLQSDMAWALRKLHSGADLDTNAPRSSGTGARTGAGTGTGAKRDSQNAGRKPAKKHSGQHGQPQANQARAAKTRTPQRKNDEAGA